MIIQFLCGCKTANVEGLDNLLTMSNVTNDEEGMLICSIHRQRRVGWRSTGRDHSRDRLTPLEVEALDLWGIEIKRPSVLALVNPKNDRRDNRDPVEVARRVQIPHGAYERNLADEMDKRAAGELARYRLDLYDRRGFEIRDAQIGDSHE